MVVCLQLRVVLDVEYVTKFIRGHCFRPQKKEVFVGTIQKYRFIMTDKLVFRTVTII